MKIIVFGAAGEVGSRVVNEALIKGHEVSAVIRNPMQKGVFQEQVNTVVADVLLSDKLTSIIKEHDVIISAIRPSQGQESLLVELTQRILRVSTSLNIRMIVVGGAASLKVSCNDETTVLMAENFLPHSVLPIATACFKQHEMVKSDVNGNWVYVSPSAMLYPGERTSVYRLGKDELIYDQEGNSSISMEDFAMAILDEAENPVHHNERFTVGY